MLIRPYTVRDVRDYFVAAKGHKYATTTDKTGVKCIELIGASFEADEAAIFGSPNIAASSASNDAPINSRHLTPVLSVVIA